MDVEMLLKCTVDAGMMKGECAVVIETDAGQQSLFVDESLTQTVDNTTWVPVAVLDEDSTHGLVRLPQASLEGSRVVKVLKSALKR